MSVRDLMALPAIWALVTSGFALSLIGTAFDVVFVLFCYSSIESGGLSFSVRNTLQTYRRLHRTFTGFQNRLLSRHLELHHGWASAISSALSTANAWPIEIVCCLHGHVAICLLLPPLPQCHCAWRIGCRR